MRLWIFGLLVICPVVLFGLSPEQEVASSWAEVLENKKGTVRFVWYDSDPFLYEKDGKKLGIEYELLANLKEFIEQEYQVTLDVKWVKASRFNDVIAKVKKANGGVFGASSISYTPERARQVKFSPAYMPDISILVTSQNVPKAKSREQFYEIFNGLTAITIGNTTFQTKLELIRRDHPLDFDIKLIDASQSISNSISNMDNVFGYLDLSSYLRAVDRGAKLKRQPFFPLILNGMGMIYPLNSDWEDPVNAYFRSEQFSSDMPKILTKYLGEHATELLDKFSQSTDIASDEEIMILTKENELQYRELLDKTLEANQAEKTRNWLIAGVIVVLLVAFHFYNRYKLKTHAHVELTEKQEELKQNKDNLEKLHQQKDAVLKVVAHDLRAPFHNIKAIVQLIEMEGGLNQEQEAHLKLIDQLTLQGTDLIQNLSDAHGLEQKDEQFEISKIDLNQFLANLTKSYIQLAKQKEQQLILQGQLDDKFVFCDQKILTRILDNLISNALKFSKNGKSIFIDVDESIKDVTISVRDEGPGISETDQAKLFQPFEKLSNKPTAGENSTGLGLSIVKDLVEKIGGTVQVKSETNKGSTFTINFPRNQKTS